MRIADEVAQLLGAEKIAELQAEVARTGGTCSVCQAAIDPPGDHAAVVALATPASLPGQVTVMVLTHTKCSDSQVVWLSEDEARPLMQADGQTTDSVSAYATLLSLPEGERPLLWVSFHADISTPSESGAQVNMITQSRLKAGWELVTQLDTDPTARPPEIHCQFTPQRPADPSTGLVTGQLVMTVGGSLLADIDAMQLAEQWLSGVRRRGEFALYLGPLNVHRWTGGLDVDAIERAVRAGQLVGCMAELEVTTR